MSIMLLLTLPVRHPRSLFPTLSFFLSSFLLFPSSYYYYIIITAVLPCHFDLSKPLLRPASFPPPTPPHSPVRRRANIRPARLTWACHQGSLFLLSACAVSLFLLVVVLPNGIYLPTLPCSHHTTPLELVPIIIHRASVSFASFPFGGVGQ